MHGLEKISQKSTSEFKNRGDTVWKLKLKDILRQKERDCGNEGKRERERDRQTERQTDKKTDRQTDR